MISILTSIGAGGTMMEQLVAGMLSTDASASATAAGKTQKQMQAIHKAALRVTAARLRKRILEAYANNSYNWKQHQEHSSWLGGIGGSVPMAFLLRANRPMKTMTAKGAPKKRGYSQKPPIKPPVAYPLGGRLIKATRYKIESDNFTVGVLGDAKDTVKNKMMGFQDGGKIGTKDPEATRRYFAAIGLYIRRSTILNAEPRPLYAPLTQQYPPDRMYREAFDAMIEDKLRVGE